MELVMPFYRDFYQLKWFFLPKKNYLKMTVMFKKASIPLCMRIKESLFNVFDSKWVYFNVLSFKASLFQYCFAFSG